MANKPSQQVKPGYQVRQFPAARQAIVNYVTVARQKPAIHGLFEVDITLPRQVFASHKVRTGESLSLTGYLIKCLAQAVDENKAMHAYRWGRKRLVVFDDVDISTLVERQVGEHKIAAPYIIRAANRKSFLDIHAEIRAVQQRDPGGIRMMDRYGWVPGFLVRLFWRMIGRNPHWKKAISGTVSVTAVGMFGQGMGWGIPISEYTLNVVVGGIGRRPVLVAGALEEHEFLCLTLSMDHAVVDGGPAARFVQRLKELLESGWGLDSI